jgi:acyl-coenzyme A thioesterase PaaI-like protein
MATTADDGGELGASSPDPWQNRIPEEGIGGAAYPAAIDAFRELQSAFCAARPPQHELDGLARELTAMTERLRQREAPERQTPAGTRMDLAGRGHPLLAPFVTEEWTGERVTGRVTFDRFYLGGNGAAHGGALPLLFDEILGRLANSGERPVARTAYLTVNYRYITRVGVDHRLDAHVERIDGRKRWVVGVLRDPDDVTVADAEGLFVELRPGQP